MKMVESKWVRGLLIVLLPLLLSLLPFQEKNNRFQSWPGFDTLLWKDTNQLDVFLENLPEPIKSGIVSKGSVKVPVVSFLDNKEIPFGDVKNLYIDKDPRFHDFLKVVPSLFTAFKEGKEYPLIYVSHSINPSDLQKQLASFNEDYLWISDNSKRGNKLEYTIFYLLILFILVYVTKRWEPFLWGILQLPLIYSQNSLGYMLILTMVIIWFLSDAFYKRKRVRIFSLVFMVLLFLLTFRWFIPIYAVYIYLTWKWFPSLVDQWNEYRKKRYEHPIFEPTPLLPKGIYSMKLAGILGIVFCSSWLLCSYNFSGIGDQYTLPNSINQKGQIIADDLKEEWLEYKKFVQFFSYQSLHGPQGVKGPEQSEPIMKSASDMFFSRVNHLYMGEISSQKVFKLSRYMLYLILPFQLTLFAVVLFRARKKQRLLIRK